MSKQFPIIEVPANALDEAETETLGTKYKFWFKHPKLGRCLYKKTSDNCHEDWSEKIASELCQLLGLPHAHYELAIWDAQRGTVSPSFLPESSTLTLGNEILAEMIPNYPQSQYRNLSQHTIDAVFRAIRDNDVSPPPTTGYPIGIETAIDTFLGYLLLDAWIGNGDRHHENWAFIKIQRKASKPTSIVHLAPTYDHASSLGRELLDSKREQKLQNRTVSAYIDKCRSALYASPEDRKPMKTFEVFAIAARYSPKGALVWLDCLSKISADDISELFERVPPDIISAIAIKFGEEILNLNKIRLCQLQEELT